MTPDELKEYKRNWYLKNRERVLAQNKVYNKAHKNEQYEYRQAWREANADKCKETDRKWKEKNPNYWNDYLKRTNWIQKRNQMYESHPLNLPGIGTESHHLDFKNVIYIPSDIHTLIHHRQKDADSMLRINSIAWDYLEASVL